MKDKSKSIRENYVLFLSSFFVGMKTVITWIILILFGFIMWAGVWFKVFQGVSGDLIAEAWDNSYKQFQQTYPGSTIQKQTDAVIEQKKQELVQQMKDELSDYVVKMLKGESKIK